MSDFYIDSVLYSGRPDNCQGRLPVEIATYDLLDRLGVLYTRVDHAPTPSIEACQEVEALLGIEICKNFLLCNRQKTNFYLLMMPGPRPLKQRICPHRSVPHGCPLQTRYMQEFLDISPGSVSVLGLMNDKENRVQLLIDRDVISKLFIGCHPCVNTSSLKIAIDDLLNKILPSICHEPMFVSL